MSRSSPHKSRSTSPIAMIPPRVQSESQSSRKPPAAKAGPSWSGERPSSNGAPFIRARMPLARNVSATPSPIAHPQSQKSRNAAETYRMGPHDLSRTCQPSVTRSPIMTVNIGRLSGVT